MVTNARGQTVIDPTGDPVTRGRINRLLNDVNDIRPVASTTARAQLVAALTAEGLGPTPARPLFVDRADAPAGRTLERTENGTTWTTYEAAFSQPMIQSLASGGGNLTTSVSTPTNGASVTLPAGTWMVFYRMTFALSVSAGAIPATITLYLSESGVGNNISSTFPVESTGVTTRQQSDFEVITRTSESTFYVRGQTSGTGGTQSMGVNKIIAIRIA